MEMLILIWLVVTGTWIAFSHILGIVIPTDELIFFRGVGIPPTSDCSQIINAIFFFRQPCIAMHVLLKVLGWPHNDAKLLRWDGLHFWKHVSCVK